MIKKLGWIAVAPLLMGSAALAQGTGAGQFEFLNEITLAADSDVELFGDQTELGFHLGYHRLILPDYGLEVGYRTFVDILDAGAVTAVAWENYFGIRYNLQADRDLRNQIFIDGGVGFGLFDSTESNVEFLWEVGAGKRFELGPRFTYTPRVALQGGAGEDPALSLTILAVSYFM